MSNYTPSRTDWVLFWLVCIGYVGAMVLVAWWG